MSRSYLHPLAEVRRMDARGGIGRRYVSAPYCSTYYMARLWDHAPAGRRVIRYYRPSQTPTWVDDIVLQRCLRRWKVV